VPEPAATPAATPATSRRWAPLLGLSGGLALAALLALGPLHGDCGFKVLLGAPCPGCGMTRACLALLHGDLAAAWHWHPLALPVAVLAAAALGAAAHEAVTGRPTFRRNADRISLPVALAAFALLAAVWLVRVVIHPAWSPEPIRPGSLAARLLE
jgi:hypothetical protein